MLCVWGGEGGGGGGYEATTCTVVNPALPRTNL